MNDQTTLQDSNDLEEQIKLLGAELHSLEKIIIDGNSKKELGGSLFLVGSGILFASIVFEPLCITSISIVLIVAGITVFIFGFLRERKAQTSLTDNSFKVSKIREEIGSLKNR